MKTFFYKQSILLATYVGDHPDCAPEEAFRALGLSKLYGALVVYHARKTYKFLAPFCKQTPNKLSLLKDTTPQNRHIASLKGAVAALDALLDAQRAESTRLARMLACEHGQDWAKDAFKKDIDSAPTGWYRDGAINMIRWVRVDSIIWSVVRRFDENGSAYWVAYNNDVPELKAATAFEAMERVNLLLSEKENRHAHA